MFVLHVMLRIKPGHRDALENVYTGPFRAAISRQEGFKDVALLWPEQEGEPILSIRFENQALQQKWVATALHGEVWPMMEAHLDGYTLAAYTTA
jgi:heme-degrading monooxygenase HmoA